MKNFPIKGLKGTQSTLSIYRSLMNKISKSMCGNANKNNDTSYQSKVIRYAVEQTEGRCIYCGRKLYICKNNEYIFNDNATIDHLIPVSDWGLFAKGNVALACRDCNSKRGNIPPRDYFKILHDSEIPTLYDSLSDFDYNLYNFEAPYRNAFPQIFDMGQYFMTAGKHSEKISITVSYDTNGIDHEITFPEFLMQNSNSNAASNGNLSKNKQLISNQLFRNRVISHLIKMSGIQNEQKKKSFIRSADRTMHTLYGMGFRDADSIHGMKKSAVLALRRILSKQSDISLSRTRLVLSYLGIAFDNQNFELLEGLMPSVIENVGHQYLFNGD